MGENSRNNAPEIDQVCAEIILKLLMGWQSGCQGCRRARPAGSLVGFISRAAQIEAHPPASSSRSVPSDVIGLTSANAANEPLVFSTPAESLLTGPRLPFRFL